LGPGVKVCLLNDNAFGETNDNTFFRQKTASVIRSREEPGSGPEGWAAGVGLAALAA